MRLLLSSVRLSLSPVTPRHQSASLCYLSVRLLPSSVRSSRQSVRLSLLSVRLRRLSVMPSLSPSFPHNTPVLQKITDDELHINEATALALHLRRKNYVWYAP